MQVSANGQPIVMLADHQSTGGYSKIATVIPCDIPALAQVRPGQLVGFRVVSVEAVSYTHLDVYKSQLQTYFPEGEWNGAWEQSRQTVAAASENGARDVYAANCNHGPSVAPEYLSLIHI